MSPQRGISLFFIMLMMCAAGCSNPLTGWLHRDAGIRVTEPERVLTSTESRRFVTYHEVQKGESLAMIARKYDVSAWRIAVDNGLGDGNLIHPGQRLRIMQTVPIGEQAKPYLTETRAPKTP